VPRRLGVGVHRPRGLGLVPLASVAVLDHVSRLEPKVHPACRH
jgi:hypothetical protein